jgi:hypothetical protein
MAWVETREGVDYTNNWAGKSIFAIPCGLYKGFAEEEREVAVTVRSEALPKSSDGVYRSGEVVVGVWRLLRVVIH